MGCKMTKAKKQRAKPSKRDDETSMVEDLSQVDIMSLDRKQLQKLCKELGLKAIGKTTELQEKLKSYKPVDVNNNTIDHEENEVSEDKNMNLVSITRLKKEKISQLDENQNQVCDTTTAFPQKKITKTTKTKKLEKQDTTSDGIKDRKKGRGKMKTEKKPRGYKTGKDSTKEDSVTRSDDKHLVDDDSFVIEKICKYDEVSKNDNDDDSQSQRRRETTRRAVRQKGNQGQAGKANGEKIPTETSEDRTGCLKDDVAENSKRTKVQASRKYQRGKKEKKVEKSQVNGLLEEEKEHEGDETSKTKSKNEVNNYSEFQCLNETDNVRLNGEIDGDKAKKDPAPKKLERKGNTLQKDSKKTPAGLNEHLECAEPVSTKVNEQGANKDDNDSDEGCGTLVVDVTGRTSDLGSCDELDEDKHLGIDRPEARYQNHMISSRNSSYHLKTIELNLSSQTDNEYESTFTVDARGHKQMDEKDESFRGFSEYELSNDSCLRAKKESDSRLMVEENEQKEDNCSSREQEKGSDSTFTVEDNNPHQSKEIELENSNLVERGSSVSSTEDGDLTTDENQRIKQSQPDTCCTRWCVVEGIPKQDSEISWKRINLKGGRPVVPNRFGKYIRFVLEASNVDVPCDFRDNYICGLCVRDNERLNGEQVGTTVALATRKQLQRLASQRSESQNASEDENNETPLSTFTRGDGIRASVKRKRVEDHSTLTTENQEELECQVLLSKRQRNSLSRSNPIPASPVVRKARGEKLKLPRNHKKAWRPKKSSQSSSEVLKVSEDASFAQKVEAIIKTTVPGSEEELNMIMSRNCRVQRSPTKN